MGLLNRDIFIFGWTSFDSLAIFDSLERMSIFGVIIESKSALYSCKSRCARLDSGSHDCFASGRLTSKMVLVAITMTSALKDC